jgi:hypothetical protein
VAVKITATPNNEIPQICGSYVRASQVWYDMIYLLTAIGLSPGSSTHLHTSTA